MSTVTCGSCGAVVTDTPEMVRIRLLNHYADSFGDCTPPRQENES